jgi:adenylate kinase family enzyme
MAKKAIILTGMPGAGKSTLSKLISQLAGFNHIEYDEISDYVTTYDNIIFDSFIHTTEDLDVVLSKYNGYELTIINMNIDKKICLDNIKKRGRVTFDITNVNVEYDFNELLKEYPFNLIQVNNYEVNEKNSICVSDPNLFNRLLTIINDNNPRIKTLNTMRERLNKLKNGRYQY